MAMDLLTLVAIVVAGITFLSIVVALWLGMNARRRRRKGLAPIYGTGWTYGMTLPGHGPALEVIDDLPPYKLHDDSPPYDRSSSYGSDLTNISSPPMLLTASRGIVIRTSPARPSIEDEPPRPLRTRPTTLARASSSTLTVPRSVHTR